MPSPCKVSTHQPEMKHGSSGPREFMRGLYKAFGAEGALIYRSGIDAVEHMERQLTVLRPELSNGAWVPAFQTRMAASRRRVGAGMATH